MHIKLCVDPVIPKKERKEKKTSATYKNVDLMLFLQT